MTSPAVWMERLRSKASHFKSLSEQSKAARTALLERRYGLDSEEKIALRSCLDHLSEAIPVRDARSMAERLEAIARKITAESGGKVNLSFMAAPVHGCFYLSTEMFYVEINIDTLGNVVEAKVHHNDATQQHHSSVVCPEIIECLSQGNFGRFIDHLNGLISVYNLQGVELVDKTRVWLTLSALEKDLQMISNSHNSWPRDVFDHLHHSPLGLVQPRTGGVPMKINYFAAPHHFVDENTGDLLPFTSDTVVQNDVGLSVKIGIEKSEMIRHLPLVPLLSAKKEDIMSVDSGKSAPLAAQYVLKLNHPMALSVAKCQQISLITGIECSSTLPPSPLMQLIVKLASDGRLDSSNRGLFVSLPGQEHCYFLSDHPSLYGIVVSSIPFSAAKNVPEILTILRQQALFNTLISSCVRIYSNQDLDKCTTLEISAMDLEHLTVTYELPNEDGMTTVEFDLSKISDISCHLNSPFSVYPPDSEEMSSKIIQKSLSIPIAMRALIANGQFRVKSESEGMPTNLNAFNGNSRDSNQSTFGNIDFGTHQDIPIKLEPMDYETSRHDRSPLNTVGPQDVMTFNPEARNSDQNRGTSLHKKPGEMSSLDDEFRSKVFGNMVNPGREKFQMETKKEVSSVTGKTSMAVKVGASSSTKVTFKTTSSSSSLTKSNLKSSVSILPVTSADSTVTTTPKKHGIEIIPLDGSPDSQDSKIWSKESKRNLSDDERLKMISSSKKRKHETDRIPGHKKSSSPSSPNSKRHLTEGATDKNSPKKIVSKSSLTPTSTKIKYSADGSSAIEIIAASSSGSETPPSKSSLFKDRSKSESPSIKLTIKNSSGSKHRSSEFYHKTSLAKSGQKPNSGSLKPRPSLSVSQKYPSYKPSSSSPSKYNSGNSSAKQRLDRERDEEVKRLLAGGKLNTTFQIPKLASKPDESTSSAGMTAVSSSANKSGGYGQILSSSLARGATTSPKYPPSSVSPKSVLPTSVVSPKVSPKLFQQPSSGVSSQQSMKPTPDGSASSFSKKTPSSSPTHGNPKPPLPPPHQQRAPLSYPTSKPSDSL